MASYASRVRQDIARWVELGLIDRPTADAIGRDVEANERKALSFGSILAIVAALLFSAALLLLIAANWEAFPRLFRVLALFAVIAVGYIGGAILKARDHGGIAEALWLIAAAAFGGSIALIGQMYHLSGDEAAALLTWSLGTAFAAAALRSGPLTVAAVGIAVSWLLTKGFEFWSNTALPHYFVALAAGLWLLSYWTRSRAARHLILLSLIAYVVLLAIDLDDFRIALLLAVVSAVLFVLAVFLPGPVEKIARLDGRLTVHALIGFLVGIALVQFFLIDENGTLIATALAAFAAIAAAIVLAGRESRGLRWIAYLGFTFQLCFVYVVTVGTMLGTAGVFFLSGLALGVVAFIIIKVEKRMNALPQGGVA